MILPRPFTRRDWRWDHSLHIIRQGIATTGEYLRGSARGFKVDRAIYSRMTLIMAFMDNNQL